MRKIEQKRGECDQEEEQEEAKESAKFTKKMAADVEEDIAIDSDGPTFPAHLRARWNSYPSSSEQSVLSFYMQKPAHFGSSRISTNTFLFHSQSPIFVE